MEFFESKEEILDIQLTEYGKYKLAQGKLKPVYYAFFDDDILYDPEHGHYDESQNDIQPRILSTPRHKLPTNLAGIQTNATQNKSTQAEGDKHNFLTSPLGTANSESPHVPAWSVRFFNENLVSVTQRPTGSYFAYDTIPQLNATVTYRTYVDDINNKVSVEVDSEGADSFTFGAVEPFVFPDDTFINLEEDSLFIRVLENNTAFTKENFDIEIFEVERQQENLSVDIKEILRPLRFLSEHGLSEGLEIDSSDFSNRNIVDYYMEVLVDEEVDPKLYCEKVPRDERSLYYIDRIFDCRDREEEKITKQNIYGGHQSGELCE